MLGRGMVRVLYKLRILRIRDLSLVHKERCDGGGVRWTLSWLAIVSSHLKGPAGNLDQLRLNGRFGGNCRLSRRCGRELRFQYEVAAHAYTSEQNRSQRENNWKRRFFCSRRQADIDMRKGSPG